jgi:hypothetical protein
MVVVKESISRARTVTLDSAFFGGRSGPKVRMFGLQLESRARIPSRRGLSRPAGPQSLNCQFAVAGAPLSAASSIIRIHSGTLPGLGLPDSSLADRAGNDPSWRRRREPRRVMAQQQL